MAEQGFVRFCFTILAGLGGLNDLQGFGGIAFAEFLTRCEVIAEPQAPTEGDTRVVGGPTVNEYVSAANIGSDEPVPGGWVIGLNGPAGPFHYAPLILGIPSNPRPILAFVLRLF